MNISCEITMRIFIQIHSIWKEPFKQDTKEHLSMCWSSYQILAKSNKAR